MNITIEERMDSIEQQLQEIKKELEESLNRYRVSQEYPFTDGGISKFRSGQIGDIKCIWDSIPVADRYKPMCLSCPCPKCSAYC
jgi:hypothetical protein